VEYLVKTGRIDLNRVCCWGLRPLELAFSKGEYAIALILIDSGVDLNIPNATGETYLCQAARLDIDESLIRRLIQAGAELDPQDHEGRSPP